MESILMESERVFQTIKLGLVAWILETDEFIVAVHTSDHCVGSITHLDLLCFIAKKITTANKNVTNGN